MFNLSSDSDASMSSENCSDAYISDDAKSEYEYESDEDDEFDWAALLDENWDDDQHDDDDEHESDFVDFEEDDERLLDEDVDLGSGGDGSSHEPGDAHAACGGLHSCGGPLHGHLQGLSRHQWMADTKPIVYPATPGGRTSAASAVCTSMQQHSKKIVAWLPPKTGSAAMLSWPVASASPPPSPPAPKSYVFLSKILQLLTTAV